MVTSAIQVGPGFSPRDPGRLRDLHLCRFRPMAMHGCIIALDWRGTRRQPRTAVLLCQEGKQWKEESS